MASHEFTGPMLKMLALSLQSSAIIQSEKKTWLPSVVAEPLRAPNSNSCASDQQSVGLNPQPWHLCP